MWAMTCPALVFRNGVQLDDPTELAVLFLENDYSYRSYDSVAVPADDVLGEEDLRIANRIGARMRAVEIAGILGHAPAMEAALRRIPAEVSLADPEEAIPWDALHELYSAPSDVSGVGLAKLTKALHKKRPHLIPMLDSVVAGYLRSVDSIPPGGGLSAATALTRSYKKDLDANRVTLECVQSELEAQGYTLSLCRILDLYTWAYSGGIIPAWAVEAVEAREAAPEVEARVDEVAELADDLGITLDTDGAARALLDAAIRELGYLPARREIRRWFNEREAT
jgi:hypothetical protein